MDVLGWSHRTVASCVIRADQNRGLGCLSQSSWNHCCRHQVPLQWRLLSPLVRNLLSHREILFPMQVLPCAKILPDYFFSLTKTLSWVSGWHLAPYAVARGRGGIPAWACKQREGASSKPRTSQPNLRPPQQPAGPPSYKLSAWGDLPHGHLFCLLTSFSTLFTYRDRSKSENLQLHQENYWDKAISLLGNQCQEISVLQRWA